MKLKQYDIVKVRILKSCFHLIVGRESVMRQPQVGDIGTIVDVVENSETTEKYIVESVNQDGMTVWLADFDPAELDYKKQPVEEMNRHRTRPRV